MKKGLVITLGITGIIASSFFTEIDAAQIITGQEVSNNGTQVVCNQCQCTATYMTTAKTANENTEYSASWELNITDDVLNELGVEKIYNVQTNAQLHQVTDADWSKYVSDKKSESLGVQWVPGSDPCAPGVNFQTDWSKAESNKLPSHSYSDLDKTTVTVDTSVSGKVSATVNINGIQLGAGKEVTSYNCQGGGANVSTQTNLPVKFSFDFTTTEDCDMTIDCSPNVSDSLSCGGGKQMSDTEDWTGCVMNNSGGIFSVDSGDPLLDSNPYCEVFCREDIKFTFPSTDTYLAGNHFVYEPIIVSGKRECRSKQIKWTDFEGDNKTYNEDYKENYLCWDKATKATSTLTSCQYVTSHSCACGGDPDPGNCACYATGEQYVVTGAEGCVESTACGPTATDPLPDAIKKYKDDYESADDSRKKALQYINKCFNWGSLYHLGTENTNVDFVGYKKKYEWSGPYRTEESNSYNQMFSGTDYDIIWYECAGSECTSPGNKAKRNRALEEETTDGSLIKQEDTYTKIYTMPAGIYQYVEKPSGDSVHAWELSSINYYDIGYSNFPIHYSTPTGTYYMGISFRNFGHNNRFSNGSAASVTDASANCPYGVLNKFIDEEPPECPIPEVGGCAPGYKLINKNSVDCSCVCNNGDCDSCSISNCAPGSTLMNADSPNCYCKKDPSPDVELRGLNIIYRPIDLNDPFPGINGERLPEYNGNGRLPGTNWQGYFDNYVNLYITNNRNVQTEKVYNLDPIYKIKLTPQAIKAIRDYNNNQKINDLGYDDFELNCYEEKDSDGNIEKSEKCVMTDFYDIVNIEGLCAKQTGSNFDSCRY